MFNQLSSLTNSYFDDNWCGAFDRTSLARRRRKKWRRLLVTERHRSCPACLISRSFPKIQQKLILLFGEPYFGDCQQSMEVKTTTIHQEKWTIE
uniref:Uncharacterized protein n=1 Tax=Heterorhabditis bacteriophora TaxID=37862 RepID=A0A1I7XH57_HETBA